MKSSTKIKIGIITLLLIVFFVILNLTGFSENVRNFFYLISAPIQRTFWLAGDKISDFFEAISDAKNLKEENEELKLKIQELNAKIARLKEIERENRILKQALDIGLQKEFKIVFAQVMGKDIAQDSIVLNKGARDGISKDMPVITEQRILVGRISQVYDNFSRVMLVSNRDSLIPVNIQSTQRVEAIAIGKTNFQIGLDRIPLGAKIKDGDKVVTSGLEGLFPAGILMGYVKNIERLGVELFQRAELQPAVDLREIRFVFVIIDF